MKERFILAGLRLISIPYFIICLFCTFLLALFSIIGTLTLGIPCWLFTGNPFYWAERIPVFLPTTEEYEKFSKKIKQRQKILDGLA